MEYLYVITSGKQKSNSNYAPCFNRINFFVIPSCIELPWYYFWIYVIFLFASTRQILALLVNFTLAADNSEYHYLLGCVKVFVFGVFWSAFFFIRIKYGDLLCKSSCSVRWRESTNQKNSKYGIFWNSAARLQKLFKPFSFLKTFDVISPYFKATYEKESFRPTIFRECDYLVWWK